MQLTTKYSAGIGRSADKRSGLRLLPALLALFLAAASLCGQAPAQYEYLLSPDVDISLDGDVIGDNAFVSNDGSDAFGASQELTLFTLKGLDLTPLGILVCFETAVSSRSGALLLPGLPILITEVTPPTNDFPDGLFLPSDAMEGLRMESGQLGRARADAVTTLLQSNGDRILLISWDIAVTLENGVIVEDEDLWGPENEGLFFDGSEAGVDTGLNLDAAQYAPVGDRLLLSFDGSGVVGGFAFDDEDVLEYNRFNRTWSLHYDASMRNAAWAPADLDALYIDGPAVNLPTPAITSIRGVATEQPAVAPRGIAALQGMNLGLESAEARVLVNDVPATLVLLDRASSDTLLFQIPAETPVGEAFFQFSVGGVLSDQFMSPVSEFAPAIFDDGGAYHRDRSLISAENPALPGETILVTGITGLGAAQPPQLAVMAGGLPAQVTSLEEAAWDFESPGVYTLEMIVPQGLTPGSHPLTLTVGDASFSRSGLPVQRNLVENGSFEDPAIADGGASGAQPTGWTSDQGFEIWRGLFDFPAHDGSQHLEMDVNANSTIFQDLAVVPGTTYGLSFAVANRDFEGCGDFCSPVSRIEATWDGNVVLTAERAEGSWQVFETFVEATSGTTRLQLRAAGASDTLGDFLDDVRVVETPDPEAPGNIVTVAGNGERAFSGDGGPAVEASLNLPFGVAVDAAGNFFIADTDNHRIRRVTPDGVISTVAGTGDPSFSGDGGPAAYASLNLPTGVAVDAAGNLFIADNGNHRIRRVAPDGIIGTGAGNGAPGFSGDGGPAAAASLNVPRGVAVDAAGNLFIADTANQRIRRVAPDGIIGTVAGNGVPGFSGDGVPAATASLNEPSGVAVDAAGNLYIADANNSRIRRVAPDGMITTVADSLGQPRGVAADAFGNLFIAETHAHRIRHVAPDGAVSTIAGTGGEPGFSGDGGPAGEASLNLPFGVAIDMAGNLLIADTDNHRIRRIFEPVPIEVQLPLISGITPASSPARDTPLRIEIQGQNFCSASQVEVSQRVSAECLADPAAGVVETTTLTPIEPGPPVVFVTQGQPLTKLTVELSASILTNRNCDTEMADIKTIVVVNPAAPAECAAVAGRSAPREFPVLAADDNPNPLSRPPSFTEAGVVSAASFEGGGVAPGEIISIFGAELGSLFGSEAGGFDPQTGGLATILGGTTVTFDGLPAPLFFARSDQLNVQAPVEIAGRASTSIVVTFNGMSPEVSVPVVAAHPGLFTAPGGERAVIINQDDSVNGPGNPEARGRFIVLYATGQGETDPPVNTGQPAPGAEPLARVSNVMVNFGDVSVVPAFAGLAPGFVGLLQVNVQIPGDAPVGDDVPISISVQGITSKAGVAVAIAQ